MEIKFNKQVKILDKKKKINIKEWMGGYLFIAPALILIILLVIYPLLRGIMLSFTDQNLLKSWSYNFIGINNYKTIFHDNEMRKVMQNTIEFVLTVTIFTIIFGLLLGTFLNEIKKGKNFIRALMFLPWVLPEVIVGAIWRWILNGEKGILDSLLVDRFHLFHSYIQWLDSGLALISIIGVYIWRTYPFVTIMISAGLQNIDRELYEAAQIDGATKVQSFFYITIPQLRYILTICTLIVTIWTTNAFGILNVMTGGGPLDATTTLPIYIYNTAFQNFRMGYAATISVVQFVIILIFSLVYLKFTATIDGE
ncbi:carbohydrate ABC transporter permease [Thermoanaerobacterium thermosulfurigenes]|uniref:carbohydrate ABC transporter permease n=1 Tax=Thermoanaerobacterium thermosulfurigenes TaxID=33950 RepID=UPI003EF1B33D